MIIPIFILYKNNNIILSLVMLLSSFLLIISTGSRSALLSALLSMFISMAINFKINRVKTYYKWLAIIVILFSLSYLTFILSENCNTVLIKKLTSGDFISQLRKGRLMLYGEYISIAFSNPFGMGATAFGLWDGTSLTNPHNLYIELLLDFGLFGGSLIYIRLICLTFKSLKKSFFDKHNFFLSTNISLLILLLISNMGVSRLMYGFPIFWIYLGFSLCSLSDYKKTND